MSDTLHSDEEQNRDGEFASIVSTIAQIRRGDVARVETDSYDVRVKAIEDADVMGGGEFVGVCVITHPDADVPEHATLMWLDGETADLSFNGADEDREVIREVEVVCDD